AQEVLSQAQCVSYFPAFVLVTTPGAGGAKPGAEHCWVGLTFEDFCTGAYFD
ncbi:hypothetical protein A2U01_0049364, partial [Trifolium medium]|nr:hypothetical protein [Trifolium medium]